MDRERDAFISYSHKRDVTLAEGLQRGLHRLARPWTRRQVINVFRDTTSLSANSDLGGSIKEELARSRYFIYLASPEAAESRWVREEIEFWVANRPMDHFLIAVSGGTVAWDPRRGDFDWEGTTALPPVLRGKFRTEPLWVDLTAFRESDRLSLRQAEFRDAVATLAAPLHGRSKDALDSEDLRQHRIATRMLRGAVAALSVLLVTALLAGVVAWQQRGEALDRARRSASQALAARALEVAGTDPRRAAQLALYAEAVQPTGESAQAMARAVAANEGVARHFEAGSDQVSGSRGAGTIPAAEVAISPDGSMLAYYLDFGEVHLYDTRSGKSLPSLPTNGPQNGGALQFSADGKLLVMETTSNEIELWDVPGAKLMRTIVASDGSKLSQAHKGLQGHALSDDGKWLAATYYTRAMDVEHLGVWDTGTGKAVTEGPASSAGLSLAFDGSNRLVTFAGHTGTVRDYTPASNTWSPSRQVPGLPSGDEARSVTLSPHGDWAYVLAPKKGGKDELWNLTDGRRIAELVDGQPLATNSTGTRALALPTDSGRLISMSDGQSVTVYDPALRRRRSLGSFTWPVLSVASSADGKWVAAAAENGAVSLFATATRQGGENLPNENRVKPDELTSTGRLALRRSENSTELWTVTDADAGFQHRGRIPRKISTDESVVAVNADGSRAALVEGAELTLWDPRTGTQVGPSRTFPERYTGDRSRRPLLFMPDGIHVVVAGADRLLLLDSRSWETRQDLGEYSTIGDSADTSGDGRTLAAMDTLGDLTTWRWRDDARLEKVRKGSLSSIARAVVVSHDGQKVAAIDRDHLITSLDVSTGRVTKSSVGMQYADQSVVFSKDARLLVQRVRNGAEWTLQFWDTASGDAVGSWTVPDSGTDGESTVRLLSGPGGGVLSLKEDGTFVRHTIDLSSWHEALCALVPEPLPKDEYDRYLKDVEVDAPCRP
ncbi:TIR domain-containing protein [Streptomyces sp. NBC_01408]|uniref:TIR domain-containing protein n=1 Tax=Streptomyces sp. NBC_01408 TaxID=2903855 RepID=UPI00224ED2C3|nr:TIR domain-containing protein [Streptomyces sp. NBC_01408]MCX4692742.1 TIR domain-containing protein [Streptomyces sp. NBC_01408]